MPEDTPSPVMAALEAAPLPPLFFDAGKNSFWGPNHNGGWTPFTERTAVMRLDTRYGVSSKTAKGDRYSAADRVLDQIRDEHLVVYAGRVAGADAGIKGEGANRYLVTASPYLPEPVEGDWSDIRVLAERLFGEEQLPYVYGWHKHACTGLYLKKNTFSQAFFMAGPAGCGKSFWQHQVVTPMLGGNSARPIQYLVGETSFNSDLIAAEHLMIEDDHSSIGYAARRQLGTGIKNLVANQLQRAHGKGKDGIAVRSRHWLTGSINDEAENMSTMPELDDSIMDKLILLWCRRAIDSEWPGAFSAVQALQERVNEQIPAFVWWLLNSYQIPETLKDDRFGVTAYQNEELVKRIDSAKPANELEDLIDVRYQSAFEDKGYVITDHLTLQRELMEDDRTGLDAKKFFRNDYRKMSAMLAALSKHKPEKFCQPITTRLKPIPWVISHGKMPTAEQIRHHVTSTNASRENG